MPVYVVQMFYPTLKDAKPLLAEARNVVAALSQDDFVLMGFGDHTSAIAFSSTAPESEMTAQFARIRISQP